VSWYSICVSLACVKRRTISPVKYLNVICGNERLAILATVKIVIVIKYPGVS